MWRWGWAWPCGSEGWKEDCILNATVVMLTASAGSSLPNKQLTQTLVRFGLDVTHDVHK